MLDIPEALWPHAQVEPAGLVFSVEEREQVHAPAGRCSRMQCQRTCPSSLPRCMCTSERLEGGKRELVEGLDLRHEQRAPAVLFSF